MDMRVLWYVLAVWADISCLQALCLPPANAASKSVAILFLALVQECKEQLIGGSHDTLRT